MGGLDFGELDLPGFPSPNWTQIGGRWQGVLAKFLDLPSNFTNAADPLPPPKNLSQFGPPEKIRTANKR
jgi:hypothetical protein